MHVNFQFHTPSFLLNPEARILDGRKFRRGGTFSSSATQRERFAQALINEAAAWNIFCRFLPNSFPFNWSSDLLLEGTNSFWCRYKTFLNYSVIKNHHKFGIQAWLTTFFVRMSYFPNTFKQYPDSGSSCSNSENCVRGGMSMRFESDSGGSADESQIHLMGK